MTVICYRSGTMAADSATFSNNGNMRMPGNNQKVFRLLSGGLIGGAGCRRDLDLTMKWIDGGLEGDQPSTTELVTMLWVKPTGEIFCLDGKSVREARGAEFYAMGSGAEAALGAMYAGVSAEEAVRIAMKVCPYCSGDVQVDYIKGIFKPGEMVEVDTWMLKPKRGVDWEIDPATGQIVLPDGQARTIG